MKGGPLKRWYGNQEYIINYGQNGFELKAWADPLYGNSGWSRIIKSTEYYFHRGVTWSSVSSTGLSVRYMPPGFIFADKGEAAFSPNNELLLLAVMNSRVFSLLAELISPTIDFHSGPLSQLPVPSFDVRKNSLRRLVEEAIKSAKVDCMENETTYDFISPPVWEVGLDDLAERHRKLAAVEQEIDGEVDPALRHL